MFSSETVTHQFIDPLLHDAAPNGDGNVFVELGRDMDYILLSKEDLLHLLKLIEETN